MAKKRKSSSKSRSSVKVKRSRASGSGVSAREIGRFAVPLFLITILLVVIGVVGVAAYKNLTVSKFFELQTVDVRGVERTPAADVEKLVRSMATQTGVWNADVGEIKAKVEKFPFVKSAAVSRQLPSGIKVSIVERVPAAVVHLTSGDFLVDGDGTILAASKAGDKDFPFLLKGWDETKSEKAMTDNQARIKVYRKMLDEWRQFDLMSRVSEVNITDPREPVAVVQDSGRSIAITLAKDNLGKSLKTAIEAISGKGAKIKSVDSGGIYPVINYLEF